MSWQDQVEAVNPPVYETETDYPPRLWWFNGARPARTQGVFYTKLDEHPVASLDKPWQLSQRFDDEVGYEAAGLLIALIGARQQPFIPEVDATGKRTKRFIPQWVKGAQIYNEWLCFVQGLDYPVVLCSKGLTGKALADILKDYRRRLLKPAERAAKRNLPLWSFWMPIATMVDEKNRVVFADTGYGSFVTPPSLRLPDLPEGDLAEKYFVGPDLLDRGVTIRAEYDAWLKEKHTDALSAQPTDTAPTTDATPDEDPTDYAEMPW